MNSLVIAGYFIKRFIGKKRALISLFIVPAVIVGFIVTQLSVINPNSAPVSYLDLSHSAASGNLAEEIKRFFHLKEEQDLDALREAVITQKSAAGLVIPADFENMLLQNGTPNIEMLQLGVKESTVSLKLLIDSYLLSAEDTVRIAKQSGLSGEQLKDAVNRILLQQAEHRISTKETDYGLYISPSFRVGMGMFLMFMMIMIASVVSLMLEDRLNRTMARMFTAPVRAWEIAVGNFLGSFAVGTLQVVFVLLVMHAAIGMNTNLSFWPHFVIAELFLLVAFGIGTAIGAVIKNQSQVSSLLLLLITPSCMLGGCFWPIWIMEDYMQKIANFIPQKWALDAMESLAKGADISQVGLHMGILALFAIVLLGVGSALLRPAEREAA